MRPSQAATINNAHHDHARPDRSALVMATLSLCGIVVALQQTVLLPLLPVLPQLLDTSAESASWLVTATLLSGAIATPTVSRLADMYGKRRMMVLALAVCVAGSIIGALSQEVWLLIAARALQGFGMALIPVGIAIMRDELPRERLPFGVALMSATLAIGAGVGPPMAGLIAEDLDWHSIFWMTGVLGGLMLVSVTMVLPESPVRTQGTFDVRGAALLSLALTAVLLALSKGGEWGWTSLATLGCAAGGMALLAAWVPIEFHTPSPLVDLRVAARPAVLLVNVAAVLAGFAMLANLLLTTQYLQIPAATGFGLGMTALGTGLWMVPYALAFGLMAPVSAWLMRLASPQLTLIGGAILMASVYVLRVFFSDNLTQVVLGSVLVGCGTAMMYGAMPTLIMRAVPLTETASANGLNVLLRALGTSAASAASAAVTTASAVTVGQQVWPGESGLVWMMWAAAATALGAGLISVPTLRMRDFAESADRSGTTTSGRPAKVVRGQVLDVNARPIRGAVVTLLTPHGEVVDWGQADADGRFTAAIPHDADDYLVITTADGWQPRSRIMTLDSQAPLPPILLRERLQLRGHIRHASGASAVDALVVLTAQSGEALGSARTDHEGRYEMPRPTNGRYVLTAMTSDGATGARSATVWEAAGSVDLTLGTPLA